MNAAWAHVSGLTSVAHCGHPTALFPYLVRDRDHEAVVDSNGRGFQRLEDAMDAAEGLLDHRLVAVRPSIQEAARALTPAQAVELARFRAVHPDGERPRRPVRALLVGGPLDGLEAELADGRQLWVFPVPSEERLAGWVGRGGLLPQADLAVRYERRAALGDDLTLDGRTRYHHDGAA